MVTRDGTLRYEWLPMEHALSDQQRQYMTTAKAFLENQFKADNNLFLNNINASVIKGRYFFLLEVTGKRNVLSEEVAELERRVSVLIGQPVRVYVWSKPEIVANANGYTSYDTLRRDFFSKR